MARPRKTCGGEIWFECIQRIPVHVDGVYSARCTKCGRTSTRRRPSLNARCRLPAAKALVQPEAKVQPAWHASGKSHPPTKWEFGRNRDNTETYVALPGHHATNRDTDGRPFTFHMTFLAPSFEEARKTIEEMLYPKVPKRRRPA